MIVAEHTKSDYVLVALIKSLISNTPTVYAFCIKRWDVANDDCFAINSLKLGKFPLEPSNLITGVISGL